MDNVKIGKFIALKRKERKLTQELLAEKLGVSKNAVSKWERGICLMDMSLLIPLSNILDVKVLDLLYGEEINDNEKEKRYEETLENIIKFNEIESRSFGIKGLVIVYSLICIFNLIKGITSIDIISMILMFISFKMYYKYKKTLNNNYLVYSILSFIFSLFLIIMYIIEILYF